MLSSLFGSTDGTADEPLSPAMKSDLSRVKQDQKARRMAAAAAAAKGGPTGWGRAVRDPLRGDTRTQAKAKAKLSRKERMAMERELAEGMARQKDSLDHPLQEHLRRVVHSILEGLEVSAVCRARKVVAINAGQPVKAAFQSLLDNNILSAPVWDPSTNNYTGYLCLQDLVTYIVILEHEQELRAGKAPPPPEETPLIRRVYCYRHRWGGSRRHFGPCW